MTTYHDSIWEQVPEDRKVPDLEAQRRLLAELVSPGERVLDLGCGDGALLTEIVALGGRAVGADPSLLALRRAARRLGAERDAGVRTVLERGGPVAAAGVELVRCEEGEPLPLPDRSFDGAWLSNVLSHAIDSGGLLSESHRVLRPGGWIGVTVPHHGPVRRVWEATAGFRRAHHPEHTTLRRYARATLAAQLEARGFEDVRARRAGGLPGVGGIVLARGRRPGGRGR